MCKLANSRFLMKMKNNSGFTLIEVLIAIVLLAFVSLYTFKMVSTSTDTKETVVKEDQTIVQTLTAVARLDSDFSQIYTPLSSSSKVSPQNDNYANYSDSLNSNTLFDGNTKNGKLIPQFQSLEKSNVIFFTAANRRKVQDTKESRFAWVKYSLRKMEKDDEDQSTTKRDGEYELIRQTITTNLFGNELDWSNAKAQVLMEHIKNLEFSFWDMRAKKFTTSVLELNELKNYPRALKMNLTWIDENNHEQTIVKTFRPLNPYFNTKLDDIAGSQSANSNSGAYGGSEVPPNIPDPSNPESQQDSSGAGSVHF
jgi:prepilin-type N-terminal cleavage/methylation domain-containing protein